MNAPPRTRRHPVRIVHLGLGAFHRSHQAWYTQLLNDGIDGEHGWGIAAFTGRSPEAARILSRQDGVYVLVERGRETDTAMVVESLSTVADGADADRWRGAVADPEVAVVTLTITEAGYHPTTIELDADRLALRRGEGASTAPGRLVDGLRSRRAAGSGGLAVVSCDNLPGNGLVARDAVLDLAASVDPVLAAWIAEHISFVSTMVDRITPATTDDDRAAVRRLTGFDDAAPVIAEPYSEWLLSGSFPAGRPEWETVGARFVDDIEPFEHRKLWLLNAGHSLLAYHGLLRGHETIADAVADAVCSAELERLWEETRTELPFDPASVDAAVAALRDRFGNARIEHRLAQIASDGSRKLGPRILDVMRSRLHDGRDPGEAHAGVLAAWALHLLDGAFQDPGAAELVARLRAVADDDDAITTAVVDALAPELSTDARVTTAIRSRLAELRPVASPGGVRGDEITTTSRIERKLTCESPRPTSSYRAPTVTS